MTMEVTLWLQDKKSTPDGADVSYNSSDGTFWDRRLSLQRLIATATSTLISRGKANLVFRLPDHQYAGTGCTGSSCLIGLGVCPLSPSAHANRWLATRGSIRHAFSVLTMAYYTWRSYARDVAVCCVGSVAAGLGLAMVADLVLANAWRHAL